MVATFAVKNDRLQGAARDFDAARGLDTGELFAFIGATQIDATDTYLPTAYPASSSRAPVSARTTRPFPW